VKAGDGAGRGAHPLASTVAPVNRAPMSVRLVTMSVPLPTAIGTDDGQWIEQIRGQTRPR